MKLHKISLLMRYSSVHGDGWVLSLAVVVVTGEGAGLQTGLVVQLVLRSDTERSNSCYGTMAIDEEYLLLLPLLLLPILLQDSCCSDSIAMDNMMII